MNPTGSQGPDEGTVTVNDTGAKRSVGRTRLILFAAAVLVVGVALGLALIPDNTKPGVEFLSPEGAARAMGDSWATRMKYRIIRLAGPLTRYFHSNKPSLLIRGRIMAVPHSATVQFAPENLPATNPDGMCSWIVSSNELRQVRKQLESIAGGMTLSQPSMTVGAGGAAAMTMQNVIVMGTNNISTGLSIFVKPKILPRAISLLLIATDTELPANAGPTNTMVVTNLSVSCRAMVTNSSTLVLRTKSRRNDNDYWLLLSVTEVDGQGKPVQVKSGGSR